MVCYRVGDEIRGLNLEKQRERQRSALNLLPLPWLE